MARAPKTPAGWDTTLDFTAPKLTDDNREARREAAYRSVFDTPIGRLVLRDILIGAHVGEAFGPPSGIDGHREYQAGGHDCALSIMTQAGFGQSDLVESVMRDQEGYYDERREFE